MDPRPRRMNSNPNKKKLDDTESVFMTGNLDQVAESIEDLYTDDEEFDDEEPFDESFPEIKDMEDSELFQKADSLLFDHYGVNILRTIATSLLCNKLKPEELTIQALAYKCQRMKRGKQGIRYKESWGMFWCGVRALIKGRGLVPFLDHFELPAKLSKYKSKILEICGLTKETLGKPGLQKQNTQLWLRGKKKEVGSKTLCVSVSMDGKKIAASADGQEDMGGVGKTETRKQVDAGFDNEKQEILLNIETNTRESLYKLYDLYSTSAKSIVTKTAAIEKLIDKNAKQLDKNPALSKYIYVLRQQLTLGEKILSDLNDVQLKIIHHVSLQRNCVVLLPGNNERLKRNNLSFLPGSGKELDLSIQSNYRKLQDIEKVKEAFILSSLNPILSKTDSVHQVDWDQVASSLEMPLEQIPRSNIISQKVYQQCYLHASQIYEACGLSMVRPLQEMKNIYLQARKNVSEFQILNCKEQIVGTFCSLFSPMTFGNNAMIQEAGIFIDQGVVASPDLLVVSGANDRLDYIVIFNEVKTNTFEYSPEVVVTSLVSMEICKPLKGCIIVNHSKSSFAAASLLQNSSLSRSMLSFIKRYTFAPKCLSKRTKQELETISSIRIKVMQLMESLATIGSYPLIPNVVDSSILTSAVVSKEEHGGIIAPLKKEELLEFVDSKRKFLAKQARELIVCNISDLGGGISNFPHTICGATFLSSGSLKLVAHDCLAETKKMVEENHGAVVLNFGIDGESLHLVTTKSDGEPGTLLSLCKYLLNLLKTYRKTDLIQMMASNTKIALKVDGNMVEAEVDDIDPDNLLNTVDENIVDEQNEVGFTGFCLDDVDEWMEKDASKDVDISRVTECRELSVIKLRMMALNYILPKAKKEWIRKTYGSEQLNILLGEKSINYIPSTLFEKSESGIFTTFTFDMAHISNLLRESVSKDKLANFGLERQSLEKLSEQPDHRYLKKILKLKSNKLGRLSNCKSPSISKIKPC